MHAAPFPSPQGFTLSLGGLRPIQPSGFVPPRHRRNYTDGLVQHYLHTAFGDLFPAMRVTEDGAAQFWHVTGGIETCSLSRPATSIEEIGQRVASRLLGGWSLLCDATRQAPTGEGIRSLLLHLHLPDPRYALDFYRIAEPPNGPGMVHIIYGFDSEENPSVPIAQALSIFLGIGIDEADSLLFQAVREPVALPAPPPQPPALPRDPFRPVAVPPVPRRGLFGRLGLAISAVVFAAAATVLVVVSHRGDEPTGSSTTAADAAGAFGKPDTRTDDSPALPKEVGGSFGMLQGDPASR